MGEGGVGIDKKTELPEEGLFREESFKEKEMGEGGI